MGTVTRTIEFQSVGAIYKLEDVRIGVTTDREVDLIEIGDVWVKVGDDEIEATRAILEKAVAGYVYDNLKEIEEEISQDIIEEQADHDVSWDLERKYEVQEDDKN